MDAEQLQLGEVDRHLVEADRPADARQPAVALIDEIVPDLHHDRNVELAALRVIGIILRVIRREAEPVRIKMRADEAVVFHGGLEIAQSLHAAIGVDAGEPGESIGILPADLVHALVGDFE